MDVRPPFLVYIRIYTWRKIIVTLPFPFFWHPFPTFFLVLERTWSEGRAGGGGASVQKDGVLVWVCVCPFVCVCGWVCMYFMNMKAPWRVLSRDLLHDMRTYTARTLSHCYVSVQRVDLSCANLTIATRQVIRVTFNASNECQQLPKNVSS